MYAWLIGALLKIRSAAPTHSSAAAERPAGTLRQRRKAGDMADNDRRQTVLAEYRKTLLAHKETESKVKKSALSPSRAPAPLLRWSPPLPQPLPARVAQPSPPPPPLRPCPPQ